MKNIYSRLFFLGIVLTFTVTQQSWGQTLLHYWNFNDLPTGDLTSVSSDFSLIPGAEISYPGTGSGYMDRVNPGSDINAQNSDPAGLGLRPRNPSNTRDFLIAFPTTGYQDITIQFATARTTQGATEQFYSYSIDGGATYITTGLSSTSHIPTVEPVYSLVSIDLTGIAGIANNPNFIFKINFGGTTAAGSSGNNRFDNVTVTGIPFAQEQIVHYWHFNTLPSGSLSTVDADFSVMASGATISYPGTGAGYMDNVNSGSDLNLHNGEATGLGIRPRNPSNTRDFLITSPTTGFENIKIAFATTKTNQGATEQLYSYSLDGGATYQNDGLPVASFNPLTDIYNLVSIDLSSIPGVANNPGFIFKISFGGATAAGSSGNNRFDNITVKGTPMGGEDTFPPFVTFTPVNNATNVSVTLQPTLSFNEDIRLVDDTPLDNANASSVVELRLQDDNGPMIPFTTTFSNNTITIIPDSPLQNSQTYYVALLGNTIEDFNDNAITNTVSASFFTEDFNSRVSFMSNFITVNENAGSVNLILNVQNPVTGSVDLVVKGAPFSTADGDDFILQNQTINFTETSGSTVTINIPILDDNEEEQHAEYFVLALENPVNFTIQGTPFSTIYIIDNDRLAPVPSQEIELLYISSFDPSGINNSTCEVVAHDPVSQRLFSTSAVSGYLDIIDFSNPAALSTLSSINMNPYGGITSVAVKNGILAVASPNTNEQLDGSVVFFDTNGTFLKQVTVGALPDMITFTPDGTKVLTANEGEPNNDYSVDPEGSVSIIDISEGIENLTQSHVTTLYFTQFNSQEAALISSGVRKLKASSTLSQDLEPEYITISEDSQKAWVSLQENNAIAEIDLTTNSITSLWALGTKDMSQPGNGFDISDNNGQILIANWPVKAYYIPDAIASYTVNGVTYLVTANEGDEKEFSTLNERTTVGNANYTLNSGLFPHAAVLKQSYNMGRFRVTNLNGNTDSNPDFEEIYCLGSRSFSIFNTQTQSLIYDSGDDFEMYIASTPEFAPIFNANHENNNLKGRSHSKGPEPEGIALATINDNVFAFIALERVGGIMVYNITYPANPVFVDYKNPRSVSAYEGDHGAETLIYIDPANSPNGKGYIVLANEISGTLTLFEVENNMLSTPGFETPKTFAMFPNPSTEGIVYFNRMASVEVYDLNGKKVYEAQNALTIDTSKMPRGMYIVKTNEGLVEKLIVR